MEAAKKKKIKIGCAVAFVLIAGVGWWFYGDLIRHFGPTLWESMFPPAKENYQGNSIDNLKAMRTALMGYEESEGQFPAATGWMDAIENRLGTDVLKKGEGEKKLIAPVFVGQPGKYGYALNEALGGKYHGDIKDPKTPMIFESTPTEKNAHGDPTKLKRPGGIAISMDGTITK